MPTVVVPVRDDVEKEFLKWRSLYVPSSKELLKGLGLGVMSLAIPSTGLIALPNQIGQQKNDS